MEKKFFGDFIEMQSIQRKIEIHLKNIKEHELRLTHLKGQQDERQKRMEQQKNQVKERKDLLRQKENKLLEIETRLEKNRAKENQVKNENEIHSLAEENKNLSAEKNGLEDEILFNIEEIEGIEKEIKDAISFLDGSLKTFDRFAAQVNKDVGEEKRHIQNYEERIVGLMDSLPLTVSNRISKTFERFKFKNPLTYSENGQCKFCHLVINRALISAVEKGNIIQECPGCGRILIPEFY